MRALRSPGFANCDVIIGRSLGAELTKLLVKDLFSRAHDLKTAEHRNKWFSLLERGGFTLYVSGVL